MLTSTYTIPSFIYGKLFLLSALQADFQIKLLSVSLIFIYLLAL